MLPFLEKIIRFALGFIQEVWTIRFRSSMDRMKDSGSFDWGSSPHGITTEM